MAKTSGKHSASPHKKNVCKTMKDGVGYLQFQYYNPIFESNMPFPKGTSINIIYVDSEGNEMEHSKNPLLTDDSNGKISFSIEHKTNLYFGIEFKETTYLNITKKSLVSQNDLDKSIQSDKFYLTKEMLFMLPKKMTTKNSRWEIGKHNVIDKPFYDEKNHLFANLKINKLRGMSGYLQVTLKPEWQFISFRYYDRHKKSEQVVPQCLMLEGYNEDVDDDVPVTRSNIFKNNCICLPWTEDENKSNNRDAKEIMFRFETSDMFIESGGTPKVVTDTRENVRSKPLTERFKYYDLPQEWKSNNWIVKHSTNQDLFEKIVNKETNKNLPLIVDLDSVVPTDNALDCESWDKDDRFTVFDIEMKITNCDSNKPYWSNKQILDSILFTKYLIGKQPRVICINGTFYDITDKRSADGDVVGARAAVENDAEVHHGDKVKKPVCNAGNFEFHYFADCLDSGGTPISTLLIYWSCEFNKGSGVSNSNLQKFQKFGMTNSKKRWEMKGYKFKPKADPSGKGIEVKPVFFFEGRDESPYKCSVELNQPGTGRANMGISSANFKTNDYQQCGTTVNEDGKAFAYFTMAHELGHAMGLDDEYLESIKEDEDWFPVLPKFGQYYPGMPYSFDNSSIMVGNKAPRLRHFWYFCRWLNETDEVKNLTSNITFLINYSGGKNYDYFLKEDVRNFYNYAYEEENVKNGKHGIYDLFLYKIGNDETTEDRMIIAQKNFDSILIVRHKLQWFFDDYDGVKWTDDNMKLKRMRNFQNQVNWICNKRFHLECTGDLDFKKVYIYFVPHYYFEGWKLTDHFEITAKRNTATPIKYRADFYEDDFDDDDFAIDEKENQITIFRYLLGLAPYKIIKKPDGVKEKVSINTITKDDLLFLALWVKNKRGKELNYTIHQAW